MSRNYPGYVFPPLLLLSQGEEQKHWNNILFGLLGGVPDPHHMYPYSHMNAK